MAQNWSEIHEYVPEGEVDIDVLAAQVRAGLHGSFSTLGERRNALEALDVLVGYAKRAEEAEQQRKRRPVTHGRHCKCSACAREDWTRITVPCGMHGPGCPAVYAPIDGGYEDV